MIQQSNTLYSTREELPKNYIQFFSQEPKKEQDKKQLAVDFMRRLEKVYIDNTQIVNVKDKKSENGFYELDGKMLNTYDNVKKAIMNKAMVSGFSDVNSEYFAGIATHLCTQTFLAIVLMSIAGVEETISANGDEYNMKLIKKDDQEILECNINIKMFISNDRGEKEILASRQIMYKFYPDQTYQVSMENSLNENKYDINISEMSQAFFRKLTSCESKDVYDFLGMNCDQKKCKLITALENEQYDNITNAAVKQVEFSLSKFTREKIQDLDFDQLLIDSFNNSKQNEHYIKLLNEQGIIILEENGYTIIEEVKSDKESILKDSIRNEYGKDICNKILPEFYENVIKDYLLMKNLETALQSLDDKNIPKIARDVDKHIQNKSTQLSDDRLNAICNNLSKEAKAKLEKIEIGLQKRHKSNSARLYSWVESKFSSTKIEPENLNLIAQWTYQSKSQPTSHLIH